MSYLEGMTFTIVLSVILITLLSTAWGPGHHLEFAERVYRRRRELLPSKVSKLLSEHKSSYYYGNIAADIINFKAYGGSYNHCHRWSIVDDMREHAETSGQEAFILGYLSHLAADSIAHNHFVPYHLARYARTNGLGHLYWEMNADRFITDSRWELLAELRNDKALDEMDWLVNATVPKKALSMRTNKLIFNHVLLISHRNRWRTGMEKIHPRRNVSLNKGFLVMFQKAAVNRVRLALSAKGLKQLANVDPNGKQALGKALQLRTGILHRFAPGRMRSDESEKIAAPFLKGMESPPRN